MMPEGPSIWNNRRVFTLFWPTILEALPAMNPEKVEDFKLEAEEEVQLKLDI